jgi:hypothetical protein
MHHSLIEKTKDYIAPPMGPVLHVRNESDNIRMLEFILNRLTELENSSEPMSIIEHIDISDYAFSYMDNLNLEKDTIPYYNALDMERNLNNRLTELFKNKSYIIDYLPDQKDQIFGTIEHYILYISSNRNCIRSNLYYIHQLFKQNKLTDEQLDLFNIFILALIEQQFFTREDLCRVLGELPLKYEEKHDLFQSSPKKRRLLTI